MITHTLHRIGTSEHPLVKAVAALMRFPIALAQWQLLNLQKDPRTINLIQQIQKNNGSLMWPTEMFQLYQCASLAKRLPGDFAEVGVYLGRSAKLLCEVKGDKRLHLFDTFEGLPKPEAVDDAALHHQQYAGRFDVVSAYLGSYTHVAFHRGEFPATAAPVADTSFAFVHLDVDLYRSTLAGLEFFYPRMVEGGMIVSHDYSTLAGVKRAVDEFFSDKTEPVIELSTSQCLIVKR